MTRKLRSTVLVFNHSRGLHLLAIYEAIKGLLVMFIGFGFLHYLPDDLQGLILAGNSIVNHLHLNPTSHYPQIFLTALSNVTDQNILWIAIGAFAYSLIRFVEAYGLWRNYTWAEWLAVVSAGLFLPVEIYELIKKFSYVKSAIFSFNVLIVIYLLWIKFWRKSQHEPSSSLANEKR